MIQVFKEVWYREFALIRYLVGSVFVSEGIQKFLFASTLGEGRFIKLGIPFPSLLGPFVGATEIICGIMIFLGFRTRLAALPLLGVMVVAIYTTKILPFNQNGFWVTAHEGRTDFSMLMCLLFLLSRGRSLSA